MLKNKKDVIGEAFPVQLYLGLFFHHGSLLYFSFAFEPCMVLYPGHSLLFYSLSPSLPMILFFSFFLLLVLLCFKNAILPPFHALFFSC